MVIMGGSSELPLVRACVRKRERKREREGTRLFENPARTKRAQYFFSSSSIAATGMIIAVRTTQFPLSGQRREIFLKRKSEENALGIGTFAFGFVSIKVKTRISFLFSSRVLLIFFTGWFFGFTHSWQQRKTRENITTLAFLGAPGFVFYLALQFQSLERERGKSPLFALDTACET